jgi:hypothetical protein
MSALPPKADIGRHWSETRISIIGATARRGAVIEVPRDFLLRLGGSIYEQCPVLPMI